MRYTLPVCLVLLVLTFRNTQSEEVCCCPDLSVQLTCAGADTTKVNLETNGYRCVAETAATVTLKCDVTDVDHDAIKSVVYQYHKTAELEYNPLASSDDSQKLTSCDNSSSTCVLTNVSWGSSAQSDDLTKHDSFNYQCYVTFVLKDDSSFSIPSNTMWIDVLQNVDVAAKQSATITTITKSKMDTGFPYERLNCDLDTTNPATKPTWYKEQADKSWKVIDVPNEPRLVLVDDKIASESQSGFVKGTLVIMLFQPEDAGVYRCNGTYSTDSPVGTNTTYKIAQYIVKSSGNSYGGSSELKMVSAVTSRTFTKKGEYTDFTCYARDTNASIVNLFQWVYENTTNNQYATVDNTTAAFSGIQFANHNRTLRVPSDYKFYDIEFKCRVIIDSTNKLSDVFTQPVIVPETSDIPITTKTCINTDTGVELFSNTKYMMSDEVTDVTDYVQKLPGAKYRWFIGTDSITGLTNKVADGGETNEKKLVIPKNNNFMTKNNQTCKYFTFVQTQKNNYKIYEVLKVTQPTTECTDISSDVCMDENLSVTCDSDANTITVTLIGKQDAQCVGVEIKKESSSLFKKPFSKTATSCKNRNLTMNINTKSELNAVELDGNYTFLIAPEGKQGCTKSVNLGDMCATPEAVIGTCPSFSNTDSYKINASRTTCEVNFENFTKFHINPSAEKCYDITFSDTKGDSPTIELPTVCDITGSPFSNLKPDIQYNMTFNWTNSNTQCSALIRILCLQEGDKEAVVAGGDSLLAVYIVVPIVVVLLVVIIGAVLYIKVFSNKKVDPVIAPTYTKPPQLDYHVLLTEITSLTGYLKAEGVIFRKAGQHTPQLRILWMQATCVDHKTCTVKPLQAEWSTQIEAEPKERYLVYIGPDKCTLLMDNNTVVVEQGESRVLPANVSCELAFIEEVGEHENLVLCFAGAEPVVDRPTSIVIENSVRADNVSVRTDSSF